MKRILALVLTVVAALMTLTSCEYIFGGGVEDSGEVTVVVENSDGSFDRFAVSLEDVENKNDGAKGIMEHLSGRSDRLYVDMVEGSYGAYVTAVGSIKENSLTGIYVVVYTSVKFDSYEGSPTVEYEGTTLYQSGVGLSSMTVSAGTVILFRAEKSPY